MVYYMYYYSTIHVLLQYTTCTTTVYYMYYYSICTTVCVLQYTT